MLGDALNGPGLPAQPAWGRDLNQQKSGTCKISLSVALAVICDRAHQRARKE